jgi:hypothetical protein
MPMPPSPGGVETAHMVSGSDMGMYITILTRIRKSLFDGKEDFLVHNSMIL